MAMSGKLEQLRRSTPDLARLDPLSTEVRAWLDEAYAAARRMRVNFSGTKKDPHPEPVEGRTAPIRVSCKPLM